MPTTIQLLPCVLTSCLLVAACGDDSSSTGGGGAGGASTTTSTTTTTTGTTTGTTTSTTTSTSSQGGGGAAPVCEDALSQGTTDVVLRNDTSTRLWFRIGPYHAPAPIFLVDGASQPSCPCTVSNFCKSSGASAEGSELVGFLEPGTEFTQTWDQLLYRDAAAACEVDDMGCGFCDSATCQLATSPEAGSHEVVATAYTDPIDPTGFDCDLATQDFCEIRFKDAPVDLEQPVQATGTLAFPGDTSVVVAFTD